MPEDEAINKCGAMFAYGVCLQVLSSTQDVVARSSGEAELHAAVRGAAESMGLRSMVGEEAVMNRRFDLVRINGTENPADLVTKVLGRQRIDEFFARLSFKDFGASVLHPKVGI